MAFLWIDFGLNKKNLKNNLKKKSKKYFLINFIKIHKNFKMGSFQ